MRRLLSAERPKIPRTLTVVKDSRRAASRSLPVFVACWSHGFERQVEAGDISDLFLFEQKRKVQKHRTVPFDGALLEVETELVGQTVTLRFDPSGHRRAIPWLRP